MLTRILSALLVLASPIAAADLQVSVLATFEKPATNPVALLTFHSDGIFYGLTPSGGRHDLGTLFRLQPGSVEILHSFAGGDGSAPTSGLVTAPDGSLYGTTTSGGTLGFGTVFRFSPGTGQFEKLIDFTGTGGVAPGSVPGALMLHADGFLYGLTRAGGSNGHGTAFRLATTATTPSTLHHFNGSAGSEPRGPLVAVGSDLYGLCRFGGANGQGSAFRLTTGGTFTSLFSFTGTTGTRPGANPAVGFLLHSSGKLFGTTEFGGTSGFGTAFSLTTTAVPTFATLHSFSDPTGSQPTGVPVEGNDGQLYGTASTGGASGFGNLYRLSSAGVHTPLHDFSGPDGASPLGGLAANASGLLHGITSAGGPGQFGRAFTLTTTGTFTAAATLSPPNGFLPSGAPIADATGGWLLPLARGGAHGAGTIVRFDPASGTLSAASLGDGLGDTPDGALVAHAGGFAGITARGGANGRGTAFSYQSGTLTKLTDFNTTGGSLAEGPLLSSPGGFLLGVAREGGATSRGTFFRIAADGTRNRVLSFTGLSNAAPGREPRGGLVLTPALATYGATTLGGSDNLGTLFKIDALGIHSLLAEFLPEGPRLPEGGLARAADGSIYGTCSSGGALGGGALVRIDPATDTWSVAASFNPATAAIPAGELLATSDGSVYGLTTSGNGGVFRYHPTTGLEILASLDPATTGTSRSTDESGLAHEGGLAIDADGKLLIALPDGGPSGGGTLLQLAPATALSLWKTLTLGNPNAPDGDDPDGDTLSNLVEYALDTNPTVPTPFPAYSVATGRLEITVPRQPAHDDITFLVEASTDLTSPSWQTLATSIGGQPFTGPGYVSGDTASPGLKQVLIRDTIAPPDAPRRFLRIRVLR